MTWLPNRTPQPGSVDWAAQHIRRMLDREEEEAAELRRLQAEGWRPPRAPQADEAVFGDGRDAIVNLVQSEIDRQAALQSEARRRIEARQLGRTPARRPTDPPDELSPLAAEFLSGARRIDNGLLAQNGDRGPDRLPASRSPARVQLASFGPGAAGSTPAKAASGIQSTPGLHLVGSPMNAGRQPPRLPMSFSQFLDPRHPLGGAAAAGAYLTTERAIRHWMNTRDRQDEPPPAPPRDFEPVDDGTGRAENIPPALEEYGATPPYPVDDEAAPPVVIFPDHSDLDDGIHVLHIRWGSRGNPETRKHIEEVQNEFKRQHPKAELIGGGTQENGDAAKERAIPGPGTAWKDEPDGLGGDGRPGQRFPDLLFELGGKRIAINTVDVDKNGQITQRELDAAEAMRRSGQIEIIYLVKKPHQLKKRNR
jgi:hypothetical protein